MKLCHLSDTHLGAGENHPRRGESGLTLRQEDIVASFVEAVDRIINIKPDVCIHAGDLFDTVRPINRVMAIAAEQLHRLAVGAGIPTIVIAGNHDAPRQPRVGAALDVFGHIDNLHIAARGALEVFEFGEAAFFALPHCLTPRHLQAELEQCQPRESARHNVLITHGVAAGMPEFSMADLAELELPLDVLRRFNYTALGHYHNCREVAGGVWYAGSTERLSQSEREAAKGFLEVDLDPLAVRFHEVPCRRMVDIPVSVDGRHGQELVEELSRRLSDIADPGAIVRLKVDGVTPETLKTVSSQALSDLKAKAFAVDIRFEKVKTTEQPQPMGEGGLGRLDQAFLQYLESAAAEEIGQEIDRKRLADLAQQYLQIDD